MSTYAPSADLSDESETRGLVSQAAGGDERAWALLLERHRARLSRMVALRMDRRLQGRIDPSDVVQEGCIVAARAISAYAARPEQPFYLWLRWIVGQRLIEQHRRHLGAQARGAGREAAATCGQFGESASANLAAQLVRSWTSPSDNAIRIEQTAHVLEALDALDVIDREILALRHFEQLSNAEAAQVLGLAKSAASKRYARALVRLRDILLPVLGSNL